MTFPPPTISLSHTFRHQPTTFNQDSPNFPIGYNISASRRMGCMRDTLLGLALLPSRYGPHMDATSWLGQWTTYLSYNIAYCVIVSPARLPHILNHVHHAGRCIELVGEGTLEDCGWLSAATTQLRPFDISRHGSLSKSSPSRCHGGGCDVTLSMSRSHCYIQNLSGWWWCSLHTSLSCHAVVMASPSIHSPPTSVHTPVTFVRLRWSPPRIFLLSLFFWLDPLTASQRSSAEYCFISIRHWPRLTPMATIKQASLGSQL